MLRTFLFTIVIYFVLQSDFRSLDFAWYYLCATAAAISGSAYGLMISSWIVNVDVATTIMIILDLSFLLTAGVFYNLRYVSAVVHGEHFYVMNKRDANSDNDDNDHVRRTMPSYLMHLKYVSIFYYANEAISITHWSKIRDIGEREINAMVIEMFFSFSN